jgi:hypothetical protein
MNLTRSTSIAAAAAAAVALAGSAAPASAATASKRCAPQKGTIVVTTFGRAWHRGTSLYACTEGYGKPARTHRMGPWTPLTKVAFDGTNIAWTVRMTKEGKATDRVWAGEAYLGRRWMVAQKPNPGGASLAAREDRVQRILVNGTGVMWVTRGSSVVAALSGPADRPKAIGTLPGPLLEQRHLTQIGTFPGVPATELAASAKIVQGDGDGDECGSTTNYLFTVEPGPDAPEAGVSWYGGYERPDCG